MHGISTLVWSTTFSDCYSGSQMTLPQLTNLPFSSFQAFVPQRPLLCTSMRTHEQQHHLQVRSISAEDTTFEGGGWDACCQGALEA